MNQKTIALVIKGGGVSERTLKSALRALLQMRKEHKHNKQARQYYQEDDVVVSKGKQSLKDLQAQGEELDSIEITEKNIKCFDRFARKYGVDYSLKKDRNSLKPRYYIFFKAKDEKTLNAAFNEFIGYNTRKKSRPSIRKRLQKAITQTRTQRERTREKRRERSEAL